MLYKLLFFVAFLAGIFVCYSCSTSTSNNTPITSTSQTTTTTIEKLLYSDNLTNKSTNEIYVLTLNLHTYQESDPISKLNKIAKVIAELDIDIATFVECAQNKDANVVSNIANISIKSDNMAKLIVDRLAEVHGLKYYYVWDWAHYGWSEWEEGIAIVSKRPISNVASTYISSSQSIYDITSRKAIYGEITLDPLGKVSVASTHLHWKTSKTDTEPINQALNLMEFVSNRATNSSLVIIGGDFNSQPTEEDPAWSETYRTMTNNGYIDTFLTIYPDANNLPEDSKYDTVKGDYPGRIDYIFMKEDSDFNIRYSEIIFTPDNLGEVSDHYGVITVFAKTN